MNPHLLNKIQSIKALRDRATTDGEKDAAQNRLTIVLAKHKLTEQDIPDPNFSTRNRYTPPPRPRPRRGSTESDFDSSFAQTMREFEEAIQRARREAEEYGRPRNPHPPRKTPTGERGNLSRPQIRFEEALGKAVSKNSWYYICKPAQVKASRIHKPQNKAAFSRAFYEAAGYRIRERLNPQRPFYVRQKSKNKIGEEAGKQFADAVDLRHFSDIFS